MRVGRFPWWSGNFACFFFWALDEGFSSFPSRVPPVSATWVMLMRPPKKTGTRVRSAVRSGTIRRSRKHVRDKCSKRWVGVKVGMEVGVRVEIRVEVRVEVRAEIRVEVGVEVGVEVRDAEEVE